MNGSLMFVLLGFFQYKKEACLTIHMCLLHLLITHTFFSLTDTLKKLKKLFISYQQMHFYRPMLVSLELGERF